MFEESLKGVLRLFYGCFHKVSKEFPASFQRTSRKLGWFHESFNGVSHMEVSIMS